MNSVALMTSYKSCEFKVKMKDIGTCIVIANVIKYNGKDPLDIYLKISERACFVYSMLCIKIKGTSESEIENVIEHLVDCNYIRDNFISALKHEEEMSLSIC